MVTAQIAQAAALAPHVVQQVLAQALRHPSLSRGHVLVGGSCRLQRGQDVWLQGLQSHAGVASAGLLTDGQHWPNKTARPWDDNLHIDIWKACAADSRALKEGAGIHLCT